MSNTIEASEQTQLRFQPPTITDLWNWIGLIVPESTDERQPCRIGNVNFWRDVRSGYVCYDLPTSMWDCGEIARDITKHGIKTMSNTPTARSLRAAASIIYDGNGLVSQHNIVNAARLIDQATGLPNLLDELEGARAACERAMTKNDTVLYECVKALRGLLRTTGKPRRDEWLNDAAFEDAKLVHSQAVSALAFAEENTTP